MAFRETHDRLAASFTLILQLDAHGHAAGAAAGALHGDENLLLLLFAEIGLGEHVGDLLTHHLMHRLVAGEDLDLIVGGGFFGFGHVLNMAPAASGRKLADFASALCGPAERSVIARSPFDKLRSDDAIQNDAPKSLDRLAFGSQ
jgi:hypothetical protein